MISLWRIFFSKAKFDWFELLIAIKIALEMLQKNNFLVYRFWIVEEVVLSNNICGVLYVGLNTARRISRRRCTTRLFNVVKVEQIRVSDDFRRVVEQDSVGAI